MTAEESKAGIAQGCPLCRAAESGGLDEALIMTRAGIVVMMDKYPLHPGHLLVFPTAHLADLLDLEPPDFEQFVSEVRLVGQAVAEAYKTRVAFFSAGQGPTEHAHMHVLPVPGGLKQTFKSLEREQRREATLAEREGMAGRILDVYRGPA